MTTEREMEKNIILQRPNRFARVLTGTRVRSETIEGTAMISPSCIVLAPTSTK